MKAKHCCDSPRGPSPEALDRAFIAAEVRSSYPELLVMRAQGGAGDYIDELLGLPERFSELAVSLPVLVDPELDRLLFACAVDDQQGIDDTIVKVSRRFHSLAERARLARIVVRLRNEGVLDASLAALALLDLQRDDASALLEAAVLQAARIRAGRVRTSSGLLVSSR
jgi:hypothetical protein